MINCIFMVYIICFIIMAKINYMWYLKEFKMSGILCVNTFNIMCTSNFNTKCVHHTMKISLCLNVCGEKHNFGFVN
jgi:hypothetical protein